MRSLMRKLAVLVVSFAGIFCMSSTALAQVPAFRSPLMRPVKIWILEIQYKPGDAWSVAGKYTSYASAQQSYTVRARHGGYYQMRIRETTEFRINLNTLRLYRTQ